MLNSGQFQDVALASADKSAPGATSHFRDVIGTRCIMMSVGNLQRAVGAIAVAVSLAACNPPEQQQPAQEMAVDTAAARAAIDSLRAAYEGAVASGNFESMGAMLAEGAVMVRPGGLQWDSFFAASPLPFPPGSTIDIEPIEVHVASHEWAYEFGNSTVTFTPAGTSEARSLKDTYIVIFRNTGDGWKVYREVASSNLPQARPQQ